MSTSHKAVVSRRLELRGVDQISTFGCYHNTPVVNAEFEVHNLTRATHTLHILGVERLRARCPPDRPQCTLGELWQTARPEYADVSLEPIIWVSLRQEGGEEVGHWRSVRSPLSIPPGHFRLHLGLKPWFPFHEPHWLRGKFLVAGEAIEVLEKATGEELLCHGADAISTTGL